MAKKTDSDMPEDLLDPVPLKQLEIPGAGRKRDRQGDLLCSELLELKREEKRLREAKKEVEDKVQHWLARKGWPAYVFVDGESKFMVTRESSEKVKVQRVGQRGDREASEALQ